MTSPEECPTLDIYLDQADYEDGVYKLLLILRPEWNKEDIKIEPMSQQGVINLLLVCYVGEKTEKAIVVRIYGLALSELSGYGKEIGPARCCGELGLGPEVLCVFKNGFCIEFVPGTTWTWQNFEETFKDNIGMGRMVAKLLAGFHSNKTLERAKASGIGSGVNIIQSSYEQLENWPVPVKERTELGEMFYSGLQTKDELLGLMMKLEETVKRAGFPHVLNHGDPNPTNIIYNKETGRLLIVDYELSGIRVPMDDLCRFLAFSSLGLDKGDLGKYAHSPKYVNEFMRTYLEELRTLDGEEEPVTEEKVEKYCIYTEIYGMIVHTFIGVHTPRFIDTLREDRLDMKAWIATCRERMDYIFKNADRILAKTRQNTE